MSTIDICIWFSHGMCLKSGKKCVMQTGDKTTKMTECSSYEGEK